MPVNAAVASAAQLARLAGTGVPWQVAQVPETTSTNADLLAAAQRGAPGGLVRVADHQSAGRGRFDRRWESPPETSLLMSVLLRPAPAELPAGRRHLAVAAVSLAVADAAQAVGGAELALKWPNDLVAAGPREWAGAKVGGVLAETAPGLADLAPALVVGVGVNVSWAPATLPATCLDALAGRPVDRGELLVETLLALDELYGRWDLVGRRYRQSCSTLGRPVTVSFIASADLVGTAVDLGPDGSLLVETTTGERVTVFAGDVTHAATAWRLGSEP